MRNILLATSFAAAMGAISMGSATAAPIATHGVIVAPAAVSDVACRTVKRVVFRNGVKRVTVSQQCSRPVVRERVIVNRGRRAPAAGISVRIR